MFLEQEREVSDITLRMSFFKKQVKKRFWNSTKAIWNELIIRTWQVKVWNQLWGWEKLDDISQ